MELRRNQESFGHWRYVGTVLYAIGMGCNEEVFIYTLHLSVTSYPDKTFYSQCILSVIHGLSRIGMILLQEGEWPLCKMQHPCTYMSIKIHLTPCPISMSWRTFHFLRVCQSDDQGLPDQISSPCSHWNDSRSFSAPTRPMGEIESVRKVEEAAKEQHGIFTLQHLKLVRVECHHWTIITTPRCAEAVVYPGVRSPPTSPGLGGPFGHGSCFTCLFIWLCFAEGQAKSKKGRLLEARFCMDILAYWYSLLVLIIDYYHYSSIDLSLLQVLADEWHPVLM